MTDFRRIYSGTDLKKHLMEGGVEIEFSNMVSLQNHTPHGHSKSHTKNRDENGAALSALSSALDCALGGYKPPETQASDIHYLGVNYGEDNKGSPLIGGGPDQAHLNPQSHNPHSRSPSLKIRRYSFLAGSRRGRGYSELFNSAILSDHFDQYTAQRDDSGLGTEIYSIGDGGVRPGNPLDTSPDSGVSESMDENKNRHPQRRRTLPCIIKPTTNSPKTDNNTAHSSENLAASKETDTYIIENGIRKRLKAKAHEESDVNKERLLPEEYKMESQSKLSRKNDRGSLPDITTIKKLDKKAMPREEAYRLATIRRDEIMRLRQLDERRRQGDMTVMLGDIKVRSSATGYLGYIV